VNSTSESPNDAPVFFDGATVFRFRTDAINNWPILTGTVRPATALEVRQHDAKMAASRQQNGTPEEVAERTIRAQVRFYLRHLKSWNSSMPLNEESLLKLPHGVLYQLDGIVAGNSGLLLGNSDATSPS
jgi:hypothetical protein